MTEVSTGDHPFATATATVAAAWVAAGTAIVLRPQGTTADHTAEDAVIEEIEAVATNIVAGVGLWMRRRWAAWLAIVITVATALVFLAFGVHVALGGAWERRTVVAMTLRTLVWAGIAAIAWRRSAANAPVAREQQMHASA